MKQMRQAFHWACFVLCLAFFTGAFPSAYAEPVAEETLASRESPAATETLPSENPPSETTTPKAVASPATTNNDSEPRKTQSAATISDKKSAEPMYSGRVMFVNLKKKFVILEFDNNQVPPVGSTMGVYRGNQFVGSFRVTHPINSPLASADILSGVLRRSDQVR